MRVLLSLQGHGVRPERDLTVSALVALRGEGLVEALEHRLGIAPVISAPGEALLSYRASLEALDDAGRFYHASLGVDPINVARTLLGFRSMWYEHGWNGEFDGGAPRRLRDMAAVEARVRDTLPLCLGQRVQRLCCALESGLDPAIEAVELVQPRARVPLAWQRLLEMLPVTERARPAALADSDTDLGRAQSALLGERERSAELAGDGTLLMLRAVSRDLSAEAVAHYLRDRDPTAAVLIAERDGIIVDNALERVGLPRIGFQHYSAFRAITQVLKLVLMQLWRPLSPRSLLQFLQHPVGPIARPVRGRLAQAVADEPGMGGRAWRAVLEALDETARAEVNTWLAQPRFDTATGAPLEHAVERACAVAAWIARAAHTVAEVAEQRLYAAARSQALALVAGFERMVAAGRSHIGRNELDALLDEVTAVASDPGTFAEAGHLRGASHPGEVDVAEQIIWWDLKGGVDLHGLPFGSAEYAALERAGVRLPSSRDLVAWHRQDFLNVLAAARSRLILVTHEREGGRHLFESLIDGRLRGVANVALDAELLAGRARIDALSLGTRKLQVTPLPKLRSPWQLPADVPIPVRPVESYSSLDKLFHHPHIWVLDYVARLRPGRATDLPEGALLYGRLAHTVFEWFFGEHADWQRMTDTDVEAWLAAAVPRVIDESGALLAELGHGVDHQRVNAQLERALPELIAQLVAADVVRVACETELTAPLVDDVMLRGAVDLIVTRRDGAVAVIDVKWGGEDRRAKLLAENRHLQLATYAYLVAENDGGSLRRWPEQAFFIVASASLLARDRSFFPNATLANPTDSEDVQALWRRALRTYRWRRQQLDAGLVDVLTAGTEAAERAVAPENALGADQEPDRFDPFGALLGWDAHR